MNRILIQFFAFVGVFLAIWLSLAQIPFLKKSELENFAKDNEKRLGDLILKTIKQTEEEIKSMEIKSRIDSIIQRVCKDNDIDPAKIKVHIIRNGEVNAFALPDNNMVIYSGLIDYAKSPEEVAGVVAHEIGHMEKNHVMKKLLKEVGLAMLFTMAGGDASFEIMKETARLLSSSAFDRDQEREADQFATEAMAKASIDPEHLANFLFRVSKTVDLPEAFDWVNTHPNGGDRASDILDQRKKLTYETKPILNTSWDDVKKNLVEDDE